MNTDFKKIEKNSSWSHQFQTFLLFFFKKRAMDEEYLAVKLSVSLRSPHAVECTCLSVPRFQLLHNCIFVEG